MQKLTTMIPKQIAYILFGVIILLSIFFGMTLYSNYKRSLSESSNTNKLISKFEAKFKADSIYLADANKMLIDKISQHIIDSVSNAYEKKLEVVLLENKKYKKLLIDNKLINNEPEEIITSNYNNPSSNVTTYSKLNISNNTDKKRVNSFNIKTYSQLENNKKTSSSNIKSSTYNNVTTYSKINTNINTYSKQNNNVTTYSKLDKKEDLNKNIKKTTQSKKVTNSSIITHNNYILDHATNINDLDKLPVYKGCENALTKADKKNCFAINISQHIINSFNASNVQNCGLKKGINKVRVLFLVDKNGNTKIGKLVGNWPHKVYQEIKKAIESTPKMKPGINNNKAVDVKYSLLIPFIID